MSFILAFDGPILVFRFAGLSSADFLRMIDELLAIDSSRPDAPDRLVDLTGIERMDIRFTDVSAFAKRRRLQDARNAIRTALVARRPVELGFARMWQTMNDLPDVTVEIFEDEESARSWLASD